MRNIIIKNLVILFGTDKENGPTLLVPNLVGKGATLFFRKYYVNFTFVSRFKTTPNKNTNGEK